MVHDSRPPSIGKKFRPVAKQATCGNAIQHSHQPLPRVLHFDQLGATRAQLLDHGAEVFLGYIYRQLFVRLEPLAGCGLSRDDSWPRHLKLVAFATHRFHENGQVQLPATRYRPGVRRRRIRYPESNVPFELPVQPFAQLSRGDVPSIPSGEWRVVDDEIHGYRRFLDGDPRQPLLHFDIGHGHADLYAIDPGHGDQFAG